MQAVQKSQEVQDEHTVLQGLQTFSKLSGKKPEGHSVIHLKP